MQGITQFPDKLLSLFEPHTEIVRKGKAAKPNEFGNVVALQEAENQIITHYEVFEKRTSDQRLLLPALQAHQRKLGRVPRWVAADARSSVQKILNTFERLIPFGNVSTRYFAPTTDK